MRFDSVIMNPPVWLEMKMAPHWLSRYRRASVAVPPHAVGAHSPGRRGRLRIGPGAASGGLPPRPAATTAAGVDDVEHHAGAHRFVHHAAHARIDRTEKGAGADAVFPPGSISSGLARRRPSERKTRDFRPGRSAMLRTTLGEKKWFPGWRAQSNRSCPTGPYPSGRMPPRPGWPMASYAEAPPIPSACVVQRT